MGLLAREGPSPQSGPVADLGAGSSWLGYRLAEAGYRWVRVPRNGRWWARQVKAWVKGDALFAFPLVRACKVDSRQALQAEQSQ
jgi:hypothetical protein